MPHPAARDTALALLLVIAAPAAPGASAADPGPRVAAAAAERLARLRAAPGLHDAPAVLAPLHQGQPRTPVIVTVAPTLTAETLAAESLLSAAAPSGRGPSGGPPFYDLRHPDIRQALRQTVADGLGQTLAELEGPELSVTQRFAYQFGFAARATAAALERLAGDPDVVRIEPDRRLEPHLRQGLALMRAEAPSTLHDGVGVSIAIVDTGIDTAHPMLGGGGEPVFNAKVIGGHDTGDGDADPRPASGVGNTAHGTACAGIAAGDPGSSGDYIGGVAPQARLYALKITRGSDSSATSSDMIAAWEWAIEHQHDDPEAPILIISTSFGGGAHTGACDGAVPAMTAAAANAAAAGITLFASAGNDGYCDALAWPACLSQVEAVGAVYDADLGQRGWCVNPASCALKEPNAGCSTGYAAFETALAGRVTAYSNMAASLSLLAPAHDAHTTDQVGISGYQPGDYVGTFGGTSAAAPYAAGAAAVLQSTAQARGGAFLSPAELRRTLAESGAQTSGDKIDTSRPLIDLDAALALLPHTGCPHGDFIELSDLTIDEAASYTACTQIDARSMSVETGGGLTLTAGARIELGTGFRVGSGATVRIRIDPSLIP